MKAFLLVLSSFLMTGFVLSNAYYNKKQFYPTVVYLTNSQPSVAVLLFQGLVLFVLIAKVLSRIFFGTLQQAEVDNLVSKSWYTFFDMCLVFAFFQDELGTGFMFLFVLLFFVKAFHWLLDERIGYMERSPVITTSFHIRVSSLILILAITNCYFIKTVYWMDPTPGSLVHAGIGIEYVVLLLGLCSTLARYVLHTLDSMSDTPWDRKTMYLLYVDIVIGFFRLFSYIDFTIMICINYPFPLFVARPIYLSVRVLKKSIRDVIMSRRAIRHMNTVFQDATAADLSSSSDAVCIICREEMHAPTEGIPLDRSSRLKKLPCSHIFHTACLRSWFQQQQTCPTCRMDVMRPTRPAQQTSTRAPGSQAVTSTTSSTSTTATSVSTASATTPTVSTDSVRPPWLPPASAFPFYPPFLGIPRDSTPSSTATGTAGPSFPPPFLPGTGHPLMQPPFLGMPVIFPGNPFAGLTSPMPEPPTSVPPLAEEELLRASAEARITALRQINMLLNAAMLQMNAYLSAATTPTTTTMSVSATSTQTSTSIVPPLKSDSPNVDTVETSNDAAPVTTLPVIIDRGDKDEVCRRRLERFCSTDVNTSNNNDDAPLTEDGQEKFEASAST